MKAIEISDFVYRPHLDGLRAIAVLIVFLYHMRPEIFSGGYLGVDIFFVLSGFVITQSLYKNYLASGKIDILNFYVRRFKRLFPALVVMVLTVTGAYAFFGFLWDTNLYLKSAVTSIFAFSNLYFLFNGNNYFHEGLVNPLLHTWSLGIEEQFYLIYPLLFAIGFWVLRKFNLRLKTVMLTLLGTSVLLYIIFFVGKDTFYGHFYFPTARFWEIGAGCALFFFTITSKRVWSQLFIRVASTLALAVIMGLQFFQKSVDSFQIETLLAVLATLALVYGGLVYEGPLIKFLKHKAMTYIGRISYSLYLWHLPVIYFANLYLDTIPFFIVTIILTFGLAIFSYHYIERPLRYSDVMGSIIRFGVKAFPYAVVFGVVFVFVVGLSSVRLSINNSFNESGEVIKPINYIESNFALGERISFSYKLNDIDVLDCSDLTKSLNTNDIGLKTQCLKQSDSDALFYLTGDSHALHLTPALDGSSLVKNLYFTGFTRQLIANEKPRLFDENELDLVLKDKEEELRRLGEEFNHIYYITSLFLYPLEDQSKLINKSLTKYVEALKDEATLIFVAPTPVFPSGPESCILLSKHCNIDKKEDLERRSKIYNILKGLEANYKEVYVYDVYEEVCYGDKCAIYDREEDLLRYRDDDHFSIEQSKLLSSHFDKWFGATFGISP